MALINMTTKIVGSDTYNEKKVLASDLNQLKGALQTGTFDISPLNISMEGTTITANSGDNLIRYNTSTNKTELDDAGVWKVPIYSASSEGISVTAGENLAVGDFVYLSNDDGKAYKTNSGDSSKVDWIGVAAEAITATSTGRVYTNGNTVGGFTGLNIGSWYQLSNTDGGIELGDINKVGIAFSSTEIKLIKLNEDNPFPEYLTFSNLRKVERVSGDGTLKYNSNGYTEIGVKAATNDRYFIINNGDDNVSVSVGPNENVVLEFEVGSINMNNSAEQKFYCGFRDSATNTWGTQGQPSSRPHFYFRYDGDGQIYCVRGYGGAGATGTGYNQTLIASDIIKLEWTNGHGKVYINGIEILDETTNVPQSDSDMYFFMGFAVDYTSESGAASFGVKYVKIYKAS